MIGLQDALCSAMEVQVFTLVGPRAILGEERLCAVRWKCRSSPWLGPGQYWVKNVFVQCDGSAGLHPGWAQGNTG